MGNVYGCSQPGMTPDVFTLTGDTTCNAGAETTVFTTSTALKAPSQGNWWLQFMGLLTILFGGSAPSALALGFRVHGSSDFSSVSIPAALLVASSTLLYPIFQATTSSDTMFWPSGSIIEVTVEPTGQNVTAKQFGSFCYMTLFHGEDA